MKKMSCLLLVIVCLISLAFTGKEKKPWGEIKEFPKQIPNYSVELGEGWTMERLLETNLTALQNEPESYGHYDLQYGEQVAISYGMMIGMGNYGEHFMQGSGWSKFKNQTIYATIKNEALLNIAYQFVKPYYKACFQNMPFYWQDVYLRAAFHLKKHMENFDYQKTEQFMKNQESKFTHQDVNGSHSPFRKLSAMVDRWIIKHKIITSERAKKWADIIVADISSWKTYTTAQLNHQIDSLELALKRDEECGFDRNTEHFFYLAAPALPTSLKSKHVAKGKSTSWGEKVDARLISQSIKNNPRGTDILGSYKLSLVAGKDTFPDYTFDIERVSGDTIDVSLRSVKNYYNSFRFISHDIEGPKISYLKRVKPGLTVKFSRSDDFHSSLFGSPVVKMTIVKINEGDYENLELTNDSNKTSIFQFNNWGANIIKQAKDLSKILPVEMIISDDIKNNVLDIELRYFQDYLGLKTIKDKIYYRPKEG